MAMNFWEAQRRARGKTKLYLALFILMVIGVAILVEFLLRHLAPYQYQPPYPLAGLLFGFITFAAALSQYATFNLHGGKYVAESIGARRVPPNTQDPQERQLLNIAHEVALASALPVPALYIIPAKEINAFAAGLSKDDAAVAISEGALHTLNRDEIQGVIAHEFGHIYNGDMKISMRLAAMVMGFFFVLYIGMRLLQVSSFQRRSSNGKGGNPTVLIAIALVAAGIFTWFFGSVLKAMVSREREYLADACSVQFTRNPSGIANALRKIAKSQIKDMPAKGIAYSHMYLDNRHSFFSSLFATHPPIEKRIEAIEGHKYEMDK